MSARDTSTSQTEQEVQAAILKLFLTARNEADAAAKARPETPTSGWITVEGSEQRVTAEYYSDLKLAVVRNVCPNQWRDFDLGQLELEVQEGSDLWTTPQPSNKVDWSRKSLPVRIVPRIAMSALEEFWGQQYSRISLASLQSNPQLIKRDHMASVPAASNYLIQARFGPGGSLIRTVCRVLPHFSVSKTSLSDHISCLNVDPACTLLVDPTWLQ
eukprot:m.94834 g.94834  ORF g.94834 m.94834 type:complete len:215 (-) comp51270_c0_seq2:237-881(-)